MGDLRTDRLVMMGMLHHEQGDLGRAVSCFQQALDLAPGHAQARHCLALMASGMPIAVSSPDGIDIDVEDLELPPEALGDGDALDLLEAPLLPAPIAVPKGAMRPRVPVRTELDTLMAGARELFELGDFSGSLQLVEKALGMDPGNREARDYLDRNRETLVHMYESKIGPLSARPRVLLRPDEIIWLNLDHRSGFVLAQLDGTVSIEDVYALCGLSHLDSARILAELFEQGVIAT
ncbi:tetratricopeptide repeat protein [Vulgatibacter incomptus]|uniref:TPR domain protein n=1 Tax=Vulgatibacter incomptus TaxID=1391653 RepID=A0A0K1P8F7_9BACT|nr:tetratricopeptide repeat protein [Vulgatibacter incomptus]AKU89782.1 TPR domain protein [Vulgatibacter incomptus]